MGMKDFPGFAGQIFWILVFPHNISEIHLSDNTECLVDGLVINEEESIASAEIAATESRVNLDASRPHRGITCNLGQLARGEVHATLRVAAESEGKARVYCKLQLDDVHFDALQDWLRDRQQEVAAGRRLDSNVVVLAEYVQSCQSIDSRQLKYRAALAAARGVALDDVPPSHIERAIAMELQTRSRAIPRGCPAIVSLVDASGTIVNEQKI